MFTEERPGDAVAFIHPVKGGDGVTGSLELIPAVTVRVLFLYFYK